MTESALTPKGVRTRAHILETSLEVFRDRGFERTTMRSIAQAARVSLGSAYYYFPSKESLIQNFYSRTHDEFVDLAAPVLEAESNLEARLRGVLRAKIDTLMPYHQFASVLFRTAGDPDSPLHPFSAESSPVRNATIALFDRALRGSTTRVPRPLEPNLPELLWLYHLGIILFWIHDRSPDAARTYSLIDRSAALVAQLIGLAASPLLRPLLTQVVGMVREARGQFSK